MILVKEFLSVFCMLFMDLFMLMFVIVNSMVVLFCLLSGIVYFLILIVF